MHTFDTPDPITLVLRSGAGHVQITATDADRTTVLLTPLNGPGEEAVDRAQVEQRGDAVVVLVPRVRGGLLRQGASVGIEVSCPAGSRLELRTDSADVRCAGRYADVGFASGSGDLDVEEVERDARVKTGSGGVSTGRVAGALVVTSGSGSVLVDAIGRSAKLVVGSGDISIGELDGEVLAKSGSGRVSVGRLHGALIAKSGSGDVTVRRACSGSVSATGASGDVSIGIEQGTAAWLDVSTVSGRVLQELDDAPAPENDRSRVEVTARTVSGDLRIHRA